MTNSSGARQEYAQQSCEQSVIVHKKELVLKNNEIKGADYQPPGEIGNSLNRGCAFPALKIPPVSHGGPID